MKTASESEWLGRAIELYLRDCSRTRSVARGSELAFFMKASRTHLNKRFRDVFGQPLGAVLKERQLSCASELLRTTNLSVDAIAATSGFGHRSTFYRVFRARFGMTPIDYRQKQTNCD